MKVIFRKFKDDGGIIALFPTELGTNDWNTCLSYMHWGQHGSASVNLSSVTVPATPDEYDSLLRELGAVGYKDLEVVHRFTRTDREARKAGLDAYFQKYADVAHMKKAT